MSRKLQITNFREINMRYRSLIRKMRFYDKKAVLGVEEFLVSSESTMSDHSQWISSLWKLLSSAEFLILKRIKRKFTKFHFPKFNGRKLQLTRRIQKFPFCTRFFITTRLFWCKTLSRLQSPKGIADFIKSRESLVSEDLKIIRRIFSGQLIMGNCLKTTSNDDLTLLNGRANDSNRESIDQDANVHFPVSFVILLCEREKLYIKFCVIYLCSEFSLRDIFISVFALLCLVLVHLITAQLSVFRLSQGTIAFSSKKLCHYQGKSSVYQPNTKKNNKMRRKKAELSGNPIKTQNM